MNRILIWWDPHQWEAQEGSRREPSEKLQSSPQEAVKLEWPNTAVPRPSEMPAFHTLTSKVVGTMERGMTQGKAVSKGADP